jgi:hypothetical protein
MKYETKTRVVFVCYTSLEKRCFFRGTPVYPGPGPRPHSAPRLGAPPPFHPPRGGPRVPPRMGGIMGGAGSHAPRAGSHAPRVTPRGGPGGEPDRTPPEPDRTPPGGEPGEWPGGTLAGGSPWGPTGAPRGGIDHTPRSPAPGGWNSPDDRGPPVRAGVLGPVLK